MNRSDRMAELRRRLGFVVLPTLFVFLVAAPCSAQRRVVVGQDAAVPVTDIEVPADRALDTAYLDALTKLRAGTENKEVEFLFDWAIVGLNARLNPVEVDVATLGSYAGNYGPRHLRVESGRLFYNRDDRDPIVATPMSETMFSFDAVPYFRLEVVLGDDGVPVKLIGHYENGRTDENPRDQ